jgi:outer membrane protein OmpA-like peptidoglycan-associated protein
LNPVAIGALKPGLKWLANHFSKFKCKIMQKGFFIGLLTFFFFNNPSVGQSLNGMSSGNYAGIAGLNFNPASIVDSRFKFDLNIAGGQYFFNNNYLVAKPLIFARRMLHNDPYNSSFAAVKSDLLKPIEPAPGSVVRARQNAEFQIPLSFMLTTGKRSAIAINLRNRYELTVDNLNPQTAGMFYNELNDKSNHGVAMNNDGFTSNFMNWQEIGFTYGRVLMNANKHFIKAAVTAKWLGGNAASFIQADELSVTFKDPHTMTLSSPRIQYARTARADFDLFSRRELFSNLEDQSVGWDAGIVYEFRGRIGNFKYTDEDYESRLRRDKNKYTLRLGVALNDVGRLEYNRLPLTRNHSANITNWDFSPVKAHNLREWDTAYSKMVNYIPGADSTFSVRLPTAFIANADLHLFGGFYVNAAIQRSFGKIAKETTTTLYAPEWFAVTPRFETRHFGLYIPLLIREEITQIGATVRLGPVYVGSNNMLALVQNPMVPSADIHAGFRIPIGYGKPTKLAKAIEKSSGLQLSDEFEKEPDDTKLKQTELEKRIIYLEAMMDNPPTVIVNNYITDSLGKQQVQTQVSQPQPKASAKTRSAGPTYTKAQVDSMNRETEKMRKDVEKKMKNEGIEPPKDPQEKKLKKGKKAKTGSKAEKKEQKAQKRFRRETEQYNRAVENELRRMRRQQAVTSTALVGAVTAGAIVDANNNAGTTEIIRDTIVIENVKRDTVFIRDTIRIPVKDTVPQTNLQPSTAVVTPASTLIPELRTARIFFASGSATIGREYIKMLNNATAWMLKNPDKKVLLSGVTDATGSQQSNRRLAQQRIDAVKKAFELRGVNVNRFEEEIQVSNTKSSSPSSTMRRVDMKVI